MRDFSSERLGQVIASLNGFIQEKNRRYGNSVNHPVEIFTRHIYMNIKGQPLERSTATLIRIDDKLARIKASEELRKNDVVDLLGYLIILCEQKDWLSFHELID